MESDLYVGEAKLLRPVNTSKEASNIDGPRFDPRILVLWSLITLICSDLPEEIKDVKCDPSKYLFLFHQPGDFV